MSDYRSWCSHCGTQNLYGSCSCEKAALFHKETQKRQQEEQKQKHNKLVEAKAFLISLGYDPGLEEIYDFENEKLIKDRNKILQCWINNDRFNLIDIPTMANFIRKNND